MGDDKDSSTSTPADTPKEETPHHSGTPIIQIDHQNPKLPLVNPADANKDHIIESDTTDGENPKDSLLSSQDSKKRGRKRSTKACELDLKVSGQLSRLKLISDIEATASSLTTAEGLSSLKARMEVLIQEWQQFSLIHDHLASNATEEFLQHPYIKDGTFDVSYRSYIGARTALSTLIHQLDAPAQPIPAQQVAPRVPHRVALPPLNINHFSGDYAKWPEFRDMFTSIVINCEGLQDVERLHYLKTHLTGQAAQLIASTPMCNENFASAWAAIQKRYDVPRLLISAQLDKLLNLPTLTSKFAKQLYSIIDQTHEAISALVAQQVNLCAGDCYLLTRLIISKLDRSTRETWELSLGSSVEFPSLSQLRQFLTERARAQERYEESTNKPGDQQRSSHSSSRSTAKAIKGTAHAHMATSSTQGSTVSPAPQAEGKRTPVAQYPCDLCKGDHYVVRCDQFGRMTPQERIQVVDQFRLCPNCLGHYRVETCKSRFRSPGSSYSFNTVAQLQDHRTQDSTDPDHHSSVPDSSTGCVPAQHAATLLATCQVDVVTKLSTHPIRILLDSGSEISFISDTLVQLLHLRRTRSNIAILGIGSSKAGHTNGCVTITLVSQHSDQSLTLQVHILGGLTAQLSATLIVDADVAQFSDLTLADPAFASPGPIDVIIGANYYGQVITGEIIRCEAPGLLAKNTIFGWIILGPVQANLTTPPRAHHAVSNQHDQDLQDLLSRFWLQEEVMSNHSRSLSPDEEACEAHFKDTHSRDSSGRYIVRLPLISSPSQLGDSYTAARRCLQHLMRRLDHDTRLKTLYMQFMKEYQDLNHMQPAVLQSSATQYFLPHHGVLKEDNNSSKIRVVFNGSKPTSSGLSLNDIMHTGPKLQVNIFDVLITSRKHRFIFITDVTKMYRQIRVHEDDQDLQQILWFDKQGNIIPFRLTTVTYGTKAAPYLAVRALLQLVEDEGHRFPLAITPLTKGRYVDDISGGADDFTSLQAVADDTERLCTAGGFPLAKWASNHRRLRQLNRAEAITQYKIEDPEVSTKILGMYWSSHRDQFSFKHSPSCTTQPCTKRAILSEIAQIFDPLGFLSPIIIQAKMFMQELWLVKLGWDTPLSADLRHKWISFKKQLTMINIIKIPRWIHSSTTSTLEIHGFSDASQLAMAAVVFIKVLPADHSQEAKVTLLCSKTKVAPLKHLTIPRLELTAAHMLAKLVKHCQTTLEYTQVPTYLWTDSSITLTWIHSHPSRWKDFVRNRVSFIQDLVPDGHWKFVPGTENPADCATRGLTTAQLKDHRLWWSGPPWLLRDSSSWPTSPIHFDADDQLEERPIKAFYVSAQPLESTWKIMERPIPLLRMLRVTAICWRVRDMIQRKPNSTLIHPITSQEINLALQFCIKETQRVHFHSELQLLAKQASWPKDHPFARLVAFQDTDGIIRVGGRLENAPDSDQQKHPAILPRDAALTRLIISDAHQRTMHGGTQLTLACTRQRYWIIGGRQPVRSHILKCLVCARHRGVRAQQLMGQLPAQRVTPSPPFSHTGVDYAGPVSIKSWTGRGSKVYKGWICVFVCLTTSAVHLDLVSDYSSSGFIAALRRFIHRRGVCTSLYSDCGTTFQGAYSEIKRLFVQGTQESRDLLDWATVHQITWHFNPPAAPHMGGKWEAAVKSLKHHLTRTIGESSFTFEEFTTLLAQVEAILNSRPMEALSDDPQDLSSLTPGHFLIGRPLNAIIEPSLIDTDVSRLSRWQFIQQRVQHFWRHWSNSYIQRQLARTKWHQARHDIQLGSLVLLTDERTPPTQWPLAKVIALHPGKDNLTRVVTIQTVNATLTRPISKLALLPLAPEPDA
ncbi:uncharacterized protein LOC123272215 [Cotesia glomerata]|uniref:uncharacterized protein LOC123272215 n=1 Tax=Cotesia glomerata TaxID=32391 RepID=UPI001D00522E|nr:uncharacterized protein LOC123272215 [Cotesia glomerata]